MARVRTRQRRCRDDGGNAPSSTPTADISAGPRTLRAAIAGIRYLRKVRVQDLARAAVGKMAVGNDVERAGAAKGLREVRKKDLDHAWEQLDSRQNQPDIAQQMCRMEVGKRGATDLNGRGGCEGDVERGRSDPIRRTIGHSGLVQEPWDLLHVGPTPFGNRTLDRSERVAHARRAACDAVAGERDAEGVGHLVAAEHMSVSALGCKCRTQPAARRQRAVASGAYLDGEHGFCQDRLAHGELETHV
eukprot:2506721-Rhodomonas_salina.3